MALGTDVRTSFCHGGVSAGKCLLLPGPERLLEMRLSVGFTVLGPVVVSNAVLCEAQAAAGVDHHAGFLQIFCW
jgi:hypothetical protein